MPIKDSDLLKIPANPAVKILLQGQLILVPEEDGGGCVVGINRCSPGHGFSLEVRQRMVNPDSPDIILMRHLGTLEPGGLEIGLDPESEEGVTGFVPKQGFGMEDVNDFRWLVDLAGSDFHEAKVVINGTGTQPNILIKNGLFYTAVKTDENKLLVKRTGGGKDPVTLRAVAAVIGVNIYLTNNKLKITWTQDGDPKTHLLLSKPDAASGIKHYEIRINNDPPYVNPNDELADHEELKEYYKVVDKLVKDGEDVEVFAKFKLKFEKKALPPGLGSPSIPCMPIGSDTGH
jgi:hypothetical protein